MIPPREPQLGYLKRLRELSVEPGLPLVTDGATIRLVIDELARLQQEHARLRQQHARQALTIQHRQESWQEMRDKLDAAESALSAQQAQIRALVEKWRERAKGMREVLNFEDSRNYVDEQRRFERIHALESSANELALLIPEPVSPAPHQERK